MQQASTRKLWKISGGIHPADNKAQSLTRELKKATLPKRLTIPLRQHLGVPAKPLVAMGDRVLKGQMIGEPGGFISASVHASSSGTVVEIGDFPVIHPSGLSGPCVVIETDGKDEWIELPETVTDFTTLSREEITRRVRDAGVVGMGGASFPASVKLNPPPGQDIHTLVINGVECEPFITCDDLLMQTRADRVMTGIKIMCHMLEIENCLIGIEDNKPAAAAAMRQAVVDAGLESNTEVVVIPTRYPSGGEKQLIYILTGKEVPSGGIPANIGFVCHNVGTAAAVADAVLDGRPLISRYLTVTGEGIVEPQNLEVLVGTQVDELVAHAGGYTEKASRLIMGGPMMGVSVAHDGVPVVKATNCILSPSAAELPHPGSASACIRCLRCVSACPMNLLPNKMYWHVRSSAMDRARHYNLFDCIECGCCSHVCPSRIPLVQYFRHGKAACNSEELDNQKSEAARLRTEARNARLERLDAEKKAMMAAKKAAAAEKAAAKTNVEATESAAPATDGQDG